MIGAGAATNPAAGANQIVLGTANSSLYVQGSLNYHVGATIVGAPPDVYGLASPLAQFYLIDSTANAFSIRMPSVQSSKGAVVTFRRTGTSTPHDVTFQQTGSDPIYPDNSTTSGTSVIFVANKNQTQFICDGDAWYQLFLN